MLLEHGALTPDGLARAVAERHGLDHLDLAIFQPDMAAANLISIPAAKRYEAVPVAFIDDRTLLVAMADPANVLAVDDIALLTGKEIRPAVTSREDIHGLISRLTRLDDVVTDATSSTSDEDAPGRDRRPARVRRRRAGHPARQPDHRPGRRAGRVGHPPRAQRQRAARALPHRRRARPRPPTVQRRMVLGVISRVKIMSDLDISERRVPQDGRVGLTIDGHHIDLRVVTLPSVHGESVVMRILDKDSVVMSLEKLGMAPAEKRPLRARLPPGLRRRARHRPDRLGQVDDAVRRARRAQHDREEHHHDRGPGRVPARRHHAGAGQHARPACTSRPACAR